MTFNFAYFADIETNRHVMMTMSKYNFRCKAKLNKLLHKFDDCRTLEVLHKIGNKSTW